MRNAGLVENRPLRLGYRALVADGERNENAAIGRIGQRVADALANALAGPLHVIAGPSDECVDPRIRRIASYVARRTQVVLEKPRLEVETVRIDVAVRALQPQRERPSLARVHGR